MNLANKIDGLLINSPKVIHVAGGSVFRALRNDDEGFCGFKEVYFSTINYQDIKSWKRHNLMTLNLTVIFGKVRLVFFDDRLTSNTKNMIFEIVLDPIDNYKRITVPPGIWFAFQGLSNDISILQNVANIMHDPEEVDRKELDQIKFEW